MGKQILILIFINAFVMVAPISAQAGKPKGYGYCTAKFVGNGGGRVPGARLIRRQCILREGGTACLDVRGNMNDFLDCVAEEGRYACRGVARREGGQAFAINGQRYTLGRRGSNTVAGLKAICRSVLNQCISHYGNTQRAQRKCQVTSHKVVYQGRTHTYGLNGQNINQL